MSKHPLKSILSGSFWGIVSKIIDAVTKFIAIPLLISSYGKLDFALVVLAISLNTYLRLIDLGMNTGGVRYFSMWFAQNQTDKILKVSQSSVFIYGLIGLVNGLVFIVLGVFGVEIFGISNEQNEVFKVMMYALAASSVISWVGFVFEQLLNAMEEFAWINKGRIASSLVTFLAVYLSVEFHLSLQSYFILYTLSALLPIPFNIYRLRKTNLPLTDLLSPKWHFSYFKEVLTYSLALFAMGIFQVSADTLRPVLLGIFSNDGIEVLADYRIAQTIALFVLSIGGVFFGILLPVSAKTQAEDDEKKKHAIIHKGTKAISTFMAFIVFGLAINARYILSNYVGDDYSHLAAWLNVWLITVLISMHTFPVSSFIFSIGKTRPLVWSSGLGCLASLGITIWLAPMLSIGAAILGYLAFVIINNAYTYIYYIPKVLHLNAREIFVNGFLKVTVLAAIAALTASFVVTRLPIDSQHLAMVIRSSLFVSIFSVGIFFFVIDREEISIIKRFIYS